MEKIMLPCVYCKDKYFEINHGSEEHAILSALGGRKASKNICCEDCNNSFSKTIDDELSKQFLFFCTAIGIITGRNKSAPAINKILKSGDLRFDLLPNGLSRLSENIVKEEKIAEGTKISITARDKQTAVEIFKGRLKKHGVPFNEQLHAPLNTTISHPEPIKIEFNLNTISLRCIAKMALTYAATCISPKRLRSGIFDKTIEYIKGNEPENNLIGIALKTHFPEDPDTKTPIHRVLFATSQEEKKAIVLIELFSNIRFSINLSSNWNGPTIAHLHTVNPITGKKHEKTITHEQKSKILFHYPLMPTNAKEIAQGIEELKKIIKRKYFSIFIEGIVLSSFNARKEDLHRKLSPEELTEGMKKVKQSLDAYFSK